MTSVPVNAAAAAAKQELAAKMASFGAISNVATPLNNPQNYRIASSPVGTSQFGFNVDDEVTWKCDNEHVPKGATGTVVGFTDVKVWVKFPKGTWKFIPKELVKTEKPKPEPSPAEARRGARSPNMTSRATQSRGPAPFSFTTTTGEMPERGVMSCASLAAISYCQAVRPEQGVQPGVSPRTRGVGEGKGGKMEISVNILNGQAFSVLMRPEDTVSDLKRRIEANADVPPEQQQLVFAGKQLKDEGTMYDYGITKNCVIFCVRKERAPDTDRAAGDMKGRKKFKRAKKACPFKFCPI